jgi:hypothetical protein
MSLARKYNTLLKRSLHHYAAWSPVTDAYEVGDYGGFRRGVFVKLGNIREFGVDPRPQAGSSIVSFNFTSSGAVASRTQAGVAVESFGDEPTEAKLSIDFKGQNSLFIRTGEISVIEMPSVDQVAFRLCKAVDDAGRKWKLGWRTVRKVYVAENPTILASEERETGFSLSGTAGALKKLEIGQASVGIAVESTQARTLQILGGSGPIALDLFKVRPSGRAGMVSFDPGQSGDAAKPGEPDLDDDWSDEVEDDPDDLFA